MRDYHRAVTSVDVLILFLDVSDIGLDSWTRFLERVSSEMKYSCAFRVINLSKQKQ